MGEVKKITPEEFAKKYRELHDMAYNIEGIDKVRFDITYYGDDQNVCDYIANLVNYEACESNINHHELVMESASK